MTIYETVKAELVKMLARQLDYSPKAEDLPRVTAVMVNDLMAMNLGDSDSQRIAGAFQFIAIKHGRWPTAYMVKKNLPRKEITQNLLTETHCEMTPEQTKNLEELGLLKYETESSKNYALRCIKYMADSIGTNTRNV